MVTAVTNVPPLAGVIPAVGELFNCNWCSDNTYASGCAVMSDNQGSICIFGLVSHQVAWKSMAPGAAFANTLAFAIALAVNFAANGFE